MVVIPMNLTLLKKLYQENLISVVDSFPTWQEAVTASVNPLVRKGMVSEEYGTSILTHIEKYGPYIFLAPHICMPHCNAYEHVFTPGVCFMKCNEPVIVEPDHPEMGAELFFAIAAASEGAHIDAIKDVMEILDDEAAVKALLEAKTYGDLRSLIGE